MSSASSSWTRFAACSLSRDGQPLQVTGRVLDTLLYFVERAGELLDKRSLMEALWPNLVVEENNLTQMIYALRRVLGERPDEHRFIVTVPGRGYRFVADVTTRPASDPAPGVTAAHREPVQIRPHRRRLLAIIAAAVTVLAAILVLM